MLRVEGKTHDLRTKVVEAGVKIGQFLPIKPIGTGIDVEQKAATERAKADAGQEVGEGRGTEEGETDLSQRWGKNRSIAELGENAWDGLVELTGAYEVHAACREALEGD